MSQYHKFEVVGNLAGNFFTKFLVGDEDMKGVVTKLSGTVNPERNKDDFHITETDQVSDSTKGTMMKHVTLRLRKDEPMTTFLLLEEWNGDKIIVEPGTHNFI